MFTIVVKSNCTASHGELLFLFWQPSPGYTCLLPKDWDGLQLFATPNWWGQSQNCCCLENNFYNATVYDVGKFVFLWILGIISTLGEGRAGKHCVYVTFRLPTVGKFTTVLICKTDLNCVVFVYCVCRTNNFQRRRRRPAPEPCHSEGVLTSRTDALACAAIMCIRPRGVSTEHISLACLGLVWFALWLSI